MTAIDDLRAYVGSECAFNSMLEIPHIAEKLRRMVRQRLAAFITPIPIRLHDGTELYLRPVLPGDGERILTGHVWFSPETHYRRYLSVCTPNEALLSYLSDVDYVDHFVWVVTDGADGPVRPTPVSCETSTTPLSPRSRLLSPTFTKAAAWARYCSVRSRWRDALTASNGYMPGSCRQRPGPRAAGPAACAMGTRRTRRPHRHGRHR